MFADQFGLLMAPCGDVQPFPRSHICSPRDTDIESSRTLWSIHICVGTDDPPIDFHSIAFSSFAPALSVAVHSVPRG